MRLCFDIDFILFAACSVMEERFIITVHRPTGQKMEFKTRTEFYGNWRKRDGGWIALQNEMSGEEYYKADDFEVTDGQRLREFKQIVVDGDGNESTISISPAAGARKIIDGKIADICKKLGTDDYFGYTGVGEVFRHDVATLLPYKGNREDMLTPLLLKEMKQYVINNHNIELVTGIEADDAVSMAKVTAYKAWKAGGKLDEDKVVGVEIDKDAKGVEGWSFNPDKDKEPRLIEGFGSLWLNSKGEVDGSGRIFLYWQIAHGDSTDNYVANCYSDIKYAGKGAYNDLVDCKTDKEAFTKLVEIFKRLYPEKKTVTTFRGEIEIDWLYVMQEMATMAFMKRWPGDKIDIKNVLDKLGVNYE